MSSRELSSTPSRRLGLACVFALSLAGFLVLGFEVRDRGPLGWDDGVRSWVERHGLPENDLPANWSGRIGAVVALALLVFLLHRRRWRDALLWAVGIGCAAVLAAGIKHAFPRPSPDGVPLSYPSGHAFLAMTLVALAVSLPWRRPVRGLILTAGLVVLVVLGLAIVKLHWHFASDVVGGWLAGLAASAGVLLLFDGATVIAGRWGLSFSSGRARSPSS